MQNDRTTRLAVGLILGTLLCACGSGGGSEPTPLPTPWPPLTQAFRPISPSRSNVVLVLVHPGISSELRDALVTLEQDLLAEGWDPEIQEGSPDPTALRQFLRESHAGGPLRAAFLIGEIPQPRCQGRDGEVGPCDLFLMDVDGEWGDENGDGAWDLHASGGGDRDPEIAVGRLLGANVSILRRSQAAMFQTYFSRNHTYRRGQLATPRLTLVATIWDHHYGLYDPRSADDSWLVLHAQAALFPETQALIYDWREDPAPAELWRYPDGADRRTGLARDLYLERLGSGLDYVAVGGHGWHQGWAGLADVQDVAGLVAQGKPLPVLVESFGCTTAGIQHGDSLAATMTMAGTQVFIGPSVVSLSFPEWDVSFREGLASGTVGDAAVRYHAYAIAAQREWWRVRDARLTSDYTSSHRLLIGDPTLRLRVGR